MIARARGATLVEIMKATQWQVHSVRGFISTAAKKHGLKIESAKNDAGERTYRIGKKPARSAPAAGQQPAAFFVPPGDSKCLMLSRPFRE